MNHPIHPESVEFAGLVMGREAVAPAATEPSPSRAHAWGAIYDAASRLIVEIGHHGSLDAENDRVTWMQDCLEKLDNGVHIAGLMPSYQTAAEPVPARTLAIVDAHHAKLLAALDAKDAEIARLTQAAKEAFVEMAQFMPRRVATHKFYQEITRDEGLAPVAAQPQGEPVGFHILFDLAVSRVRFDDAFLIRDAFLQAEYECAVKAMSIETARDVLRLRQKFYTHPIAQPAVPVTDAEVEAAVVRFYGQGPVAICHGDMRAALNAFLASRGQA